MQVPTEMHVSLTRFVRTVCMVAVGLADKRIVAYAMHFCRLWSAGRCINFGAYACRIWAKLDKAAHVLGRKWKIKNFKKKFEMFSEVGIWSPF